MASLLCCAASPAEQRDTLLEILHTDIAVTTMPPLSWHALGWLRTAQRQCQLQPLLSTAGCSSVTLHPSPAGRRAAPGDDAHCPWLHSPSSTILHARTMFRYTQPHVHVHSMNLPRPLFLPNPASPGPSWGWVASGSCIPDRREHSHRAVTSPSLP